MRKYLDAIRRGEEPDVSYLVREFPDEAAALADAVRETTRYAASRTKERMWDRRDALLRTGGEDVTLGAALKRCRLTLGKSEVWVASSLQKRGLSVASRAIQKLEQDAVSPVAVKPARIWRALADLLGIDRTHLMTLLEGAVRQPRTVQQFTRMERGATSEDRVGFLAASAGGADEDDRQVDSYLVSVRAELGLPSAPSATDSTQEVVLLESDEDDFS
jgi:hypothetical protein